MHNYKNNIKWIIVLAYLRYHCKIIIYVEEPKFFIKNNLLLRDSIVNDEIKKSYNWKNWIKSQISHNWSLSKNWTSWYI